MPHIDVTLRLLAAAALTSLLGLLPVAARADPPRTGGASIPSRPVITSLSCDQGQPRCARGDLLTLRGEDLGDARTVTFLGRRGRHDDQRSRPLLMADHQLTVRIPRGAHSGTIRVTSTSARTARSRARVLIEGNTAGTPRPGAATTRVFAGGAPANFRYRAPTNTAVAATVEAFRVTDGVAVASWPVQPSGNGAGLVNWDGTVNDVAVPNGRYAFRVSGEARAAVAVDGPSQAAFDVFDAIFPIRGKHDLGQSAANDFGGPRGHMGQDLFAACGTRLLAARGGTVTFTGQHSRAGNYVVIQGPDKQSYVYMHMRAPSPLRKGQRVLTGQTVGEVGETGRASGCHLHFELWTAPGWYSGGSPVDPLPELTRWDAFS